MADPSRRRRSPGSTAFGVSVVAMLVQPVWFFLLVSLTRDRNLALEGWAVDLALLAVVFLPASVSLVAGGLAVRAGHAWWALVPSALVVASAFLLWGPQLLGDNPDPAAVVPLIASVLLVLVPAFWPHHRRHGGHGTGGRTTG